MTALPAVVAVNVAAYRLSESAEAGQWGAVAWRLAGKVWDCEEER